MKYYCPCGCGKEVRNNAFWYEEKCGRVGKKLGIAMPQGGEVHSRERLMKKVKAVRRKYGNGI